MDGLTIDMSSLDGTHMITLVGTSELDCNAGDHQPLVHHVLDNTQMLPETSCTSLSKPSKTSCTYGSIGDPLCTTSPFCLVCNAKLGVSARGAMNIFLDNVKTTHRQLNLDVVLGSIVSRELTTCQVHSNILCKKCFRLIDDIDSLEGQVVSLKQDVVNKYMKTLAIVKQDSETALSRSAATYDEEEDPLDLEGASNLDKDDKEFTIYMGRGSRPKKNGRKRSRKSIPMVKLEVKEEADDDLILGLSAVNTSEVFQNSTTFAKCNIVSSHPVDDLQATCLGDVDGCKDDDMMMVESMLGVDDVMEVDVLDLEENTTTGTLQLSGLNLASLSGESLNLPPVTSSEFEALNNDQTLPIQDESSEKYKCRYCSTKAQHLQDMQRHMREVHPDRLFECEVCQERLTTKAQLLDHLEQHVSSGEKPYSCCLCPRRYALPRQLKEHQRNHLYKTERCPQCPRRYRSDNALQEHINTHTGYRPYGCDQCDKKFTSKTILRTHVKTHQVRVRPHKCKLCSKSFLTVHHLYDHMNIHDKKKMFVCDSCGKSFGTTRSRDLHTLTHTGIKKFACRMCNKHFARKGEVDDHERTHTGEKPFQCEICGATFSQRSNLQSHKKATHFEQKNYPCTQCPKAFKRRRLLVYHVMSVHTGERPFKCQHCTAAFVYPEHYRKHLRVHTGEKPFKCDICGKAFNSRDNKNAHKFIHSDKKPYECVLCGSGFMRKPMLITHLRQHGRTAPLDSYIKVNPADLIANEISDKARLASPATTIQSVKIDEDQSLESFDSPVQLVRTSLQDGDVVDDVSRPVHIIDADELPRYIIHTTGDRPDESVGHFLASLQGQVVEVRADDLEPYTELTSEQISEVAQAVADQSIVSGTSASVQQMTVANDLRQFQIQLDQTNREISLQGHSGQILREVTATVVSSAPSIQTTTSLFQQSSNSLIGANSRQSTFDSSPSLAYRKILTIDKEESLVSNPEGRLSRSWHHHTITPEPDFIGS